MYKYDLHIKNGEVIDGTGAPKFKADIVVDNGKIIGVFCPENKDVRDPSENHFLSNFQQQQSLMQKIKLFLLDLLMYIPMMMKMFLKIHLCPQRLVKVLQHVLLVTAV